jgi:two-component system cell cycle sensor histidine kinase/response regulator CckA
MKILRLIKEMTINFISSGLQDTDIEIMQKVKLINLMSFITILILVPFGIIDLIQGHEAVGGFVLVIAAVIIFNQIILRRSGNYLVPIYCGISIVAVYFLYAFVTGGVHNTGFLWYFTFPLFALFLLGTGRGSIATGVMLLLAVLFFSTEPNSSTFATYSRAFKIRFVISYVVVFLFSYLFETLKQRAQRTLTLQHAELQHTVNDLKASEVKLHKAHEELEYKVEARTADLKRVNEQLEKEVEERRRAEETLRESEEKHRTILESMEEGYFEVDLAGNFTFFNNALCKISGYSRKELLGMNNRDYTTPETAKRMYRIFNEIYCTGQPAKIMDYEIIKRDSSELILEMSTSLIQDSSGQPIGFRGVVRDVTERKRAEEALRESEQNFRRLFEQSIDAVIIHKKGKIINANDSTCKMLGYSQNQLRAMTIMDLHGDSDREETKQRIYRDEKLLQFETRLIKADGTSIDVEISSNIIDLQKRLTQVVIRDITERKRADAAIRESETRFRLLVENTTDTLFLHDFDGKIIDANEHACKNLGYTREELLSLSIHDIDQDVVSGGHFEQWERMVPGMPITLEGVHRRKDATTFPVEIRLVVFESGGERLMLGVVRDITERKRAEEEQRKLETQLQYAQKMEALGNLAGGIAHNFNNLLMGIMGNTSLLQLETESESPQYERLKKIEKLVDSGSLLTKQLLGYAREGRYEIKPINMNRIVRETSDTFAMTKKNIRVYQELGEGVHAVKADQGQMEQVLWNLYVNAGDAMPNGGELFLRTMNVTDKEMRGKPYDVRAGNYVLMTVRDTGVGMDEKTMDRIFEPFFTTKGLSKGTGLGLASVYGMVKAHGGYIDVDSKKGKGTTFHIYLPASGEEVPEKEAPRETIEEGTEAILLVDDEQMVLEVNQEMLEMMGYTVLAATGGKEAIALYKENNEVISLVILDMIMPDMSGGETYDHLKAINPNIKVLLSSGYSLDGEAEEILKRGCDGFIQKPFDIKEVSHKVREIVDKK